MDATTTAHEPRSPHNPPKKATRATARATPAHRKHGSTATRAHRPAKASSASKKVANMMIDLPEPSLDEVRALVRQHPLASVGAAVATGFLVGGGWRSRLGRVVLMAAVRYAAMKAVEQYVED